MCSCGGMDRSRERVRFWGDLDVMSADKQATADCAARSVAADDESNDAPDTHLCTKLVMACIVMTYVVIDYTGMAYIVMAYIVAAYIGMAYVVMAYIVMADDESNDAPDAHVCKPLSTTCLPEKSLSSP